MTELEHNVIEAAGCYIDAFSTFARFIASHSGENPSYQLAQEQAGLMMLEVQAQIDLMLAVAALREERLTSEITPEEFLRACLKPGDGDGVC